MSCAKIHLIADDLESDKSQLQGNTNSTPAVHLDLVAPCHGFCVAIHLPLLDLLPLWGHIVQPSAQPK